jgi:hypothetical protein
MMSTPPARRWQASARFLPGRMCCCSSGRMAEKAIGCFIPTRVDAFLRSLRGCHDSTRGGPTRLSGQSSACTQTAVSRCIGLAETNIGMNRTPNREGLVSAWLMTARVAPALRCGSRKSGECRSWLASHLCVRLKLPVAYRGAPPRNAQGRSARSASNSAFARRVCAAFRAALLRPSTDLGSNESPNFTGLWSLPSHCGAFGI